MQLFLGVILAIASVIVFTLFAIEKYEEKNMM